MSPLCESFLEPDQLDAHGAVLPARMSACASSASSCSSRSTSRRRRSSPTTPTSRRTPTAGWSTRGATSRRSASGFELGADSLVVESRATTATCSSTSSDAASRCSASSRRANVAEVGRREGRADAWSTFFGRASRRKRLAGARAAADLLVGNNVLAHVPDLNDFVARSRSPARAERRRHASSSRTCCGSMDGNQFDTIYHEHFSYFSFLTAERSPRRPRPRGVRRRGAPDPRRLAADLRPPRATTRSAVTAAVAATARSASERPASTTHRATTRRSRSRWRRPSASLLEFLIDAKRDGQDDRRLRRTRQGQHAAQLLRHPHRLPRLHGRPQPAQAGPVPAGDAHPDSITPSGSPRRSPTTS